MRRSRTAKAMLMAAAGTGTVQKGNIGQIPTHQMVDCSELFNVVAFTFGKAFENANFSLSTRIIRTENGKSIYSAIAHTLSPCIAPNISEETRHKTEIHIAMLLIFAMHSSILVRHLSWLKCMCI